MLTCSKFWFYGSLASNNGEINIQVDDDSQVISQQSNTMINGSLLYEFDNLFYQNHNIYIKKNDDDENKRVNLRYIYCANIQSLTPTPAPPVLEKFHVLLLILIPTNFSLNAVVINQKMIQKLKLKCFVQFSLISKMKMMVAVFMLIIQKINKITLILTILHS